jgi:hypothetical protein
MAGLVMLRVHTMAWLFFTLFPNEYASLHLAATSSTKSHNINPRLRERTSSVSMQILSGKDPAPANCFHGINKAIWLAYALSLPCLITM